MGLEYTQLIMDLEEELRLSIPDDAARGFRTVGDLYLHLLARTPAQQRVDARCPSIAAFCRVRRALLSVVAVPGKRIRPQTTLRELFAEVRPGRVWPELSRQVGVALPTLARPWWAWDLYVLPLLIALAAAVVGGSAAWFLGLLPVLLVITAICAERLARAYGGLPAKCDTVRDLTAAVLRRLPAEERGAAGLWLTVQRAVAEIACVREAEITRDLRFVEDLQIG